MVSFFHPKNSHNFQSEIPIICSPKILIFSKKRPILCENRLKKCSFRRVSHIFSHHFTLLQSFIYVIINNITKQVKKQQESEAGANNKTREITAGESPANKKKENRDAILLSGPSRA